LFLGFYVAVWTLVGLAVYALYRPHGTSTAGTLVVAAGIYELTPLKRESRRCCHEPCIRESNTGSAASAQASG
jgi:hypothetical protein